MNRLSPAAAASRLRILQVLEPSGGGSGRHFIDLSRGLAQRGHRVTAIYSPVRAEARFVEELACAGLDAVLPLAMERAVGLSDLGAFLRLARFIRQYGPFDIVHGHSSKAGALTRLGLPFARAPRIYTPHAFRTMDPTLSGKGRQLYGGIERLLGGAFSDRIICVSQDEYTHALALGIASSKLRLVVNGVADPPSGARHTLRAAFGYGEDTPVLGFVGRLSPQKAPERLIAAFGQLKAREPQARLLMIGSGELEGAVRRAIAAAGLEDAVTLTDQLQGAEAMQAFDALVLPSRYEAMSYVLLEAAAAGKPIIATDVGGVASVVEQGVNGIIVKNDDAAQPLAAAMASLCEPRIYDRMRQAAVARAALFGLSSMIDATVAVYRESL